MIGGHKRLAHICCWLQIPGSHRQGQLAHQLTSDNANQLSKGQTVRVASGTERSAVELVLRPGQASLHHEKLVHASGPAAPGSRRLGLAVRYISGTEQPAHPPDWATRLRGGQADRSVANTPWLLCERPAVLGVTAALRQHAVVHERRGQIDRAVTSALDSIVAAGGEAVVVRNDDLAASKYARASSSSRL